MDASLEVTVGDEVSFRFTVVNDDHESVELTFRDAGRADFAVNDETGSEVWRWSDGRAFAQVLSTARLEPGEEATFEAEWPDARPGNYTAEAILRTRERDVAARTPFSV